MAVEFREVLDRRRMVRRYCDDPVDDDALARIIDAFRRGPSAGFSQGQYLVVVQDDGRRTALAHACREPEYLARGFDPWLSVAPVHLVPCVRADDYVDRYAEADKAGSAGPGQWQVPFWWVDGGAALMLLLLAVVDEGLAAGFLDLADRGAVRRILDLPADVEPLGLVTVGHAAEGSPRGSAARGRRPRSEVVRHDGW